MPDRENQAKHYVPVGTLGQPQYLPGNFLFSSDLRAEQNYRLQRQRRHNRYLHDWGIVCGLWVVPAKDRKKPWSVQVCPGYAISCCGDEIEVPAPVKIDVRNYLWRAPGKHNALPPVAYVGIRYIEYQTKLTPMDQSSCVCEDTVYQPSRVVSGYQVDILWAPPEVSEVPDFNVCQHHLVPCPECTDNAYVLLAHINLPRSQGDPIAKHHIDN